MINTLAKMLGQSHNGPALTEHTTSRRSFISRALKTSAMALVAGSAAAKVNEAGAQAADPCRFCINNYPQCPEIETYYVCDEFDRAYKCCACFYTGGFRVQCNHTCERLQVNCAFLGL